MVPAALLCLWRGGDAWLALNLLCLAGLIGELLLLAPRAPRRGPLFVALGTLYAALAAASLIWLRARPAAGWDDVLFLLLVVWSTDIGAYLVGRRFGGRKLAPSISPGKTWSGAAGGLGAGMVIGLLIASFANHPSPGGGVIAGGVVSLVAQIGDLMESALKRWLNVKDSGRTIPGHGGLFDRLDGILAAAPFAALFALAVQGGMPLWR